MREIKFRGRTDDNKTWIVFDLKNLLDSKYMDNFMTKIDTDTLEEFTGLLDKNGKEIFEGDIMKTECSKDGTDEKYIGVVEWKGNHFGVGFSIVEQDSMVDYDDEWQKFEVIGNIHENPGAFRITIKRHYN